MTQTPVYLKLDKKSIVDKKEVLIEDVAQLASSDPKLIDKIKKLKVMKVDVDTKKNYVISILRVIKVISEHCPEADIQNVGEIDFIVCYWPDRKKEKKLMVIIKIVVIFLMLFTGTAVAIMSFYNDASVSEVFQLTYKLFTGIDTTKPTILEFFYSVGIAVGITIFFNQFTKIKLMDDPTPIEVELRAYEKDVEDSIIESLGEEKNNLDLE